MRNGPRFFADDVPPGWRRRRIAFVVVLLVATASLVWPIYPMFSGVRPLILGLPLSMAWVVFWLLVVFGAMLALYRSEER